MNIDLSEKTTHQMTLAAMQAYPHECCGILIGKKGDTVTISETREATNQIQGERTKQHFEIDPMFLYQVECELEGSGQEIVGFYHSHPDCKAIPSEQDLEHMIPGLVYAILSVTKDGVADLMMYERDCGLLRFARNDECTRL